MVSRRRCGWLLSLALMAGSGAAFAGSLSWSGADGLWSDAASWGGVGPTGGDDATIAGAVTVTLEADAAVRCLFLTGGATLRQTDGALACTYGSDNALALGSVANGGNAAYRMEGGTLYVAGNPHIGQHGEGTFELVGGEFTSLGYFSIGRYTTGNGTLVVSGTGVVNKVLYSMLVAEEGTGLCVVKDGGQIKIAQDVPAIGDVPGGLWIAWTANATGTLRLEPGGRIAAPHVALVYAGATFILDGGVLSVPADMGGTVSGFIDQRAGHVYVGPRGAFLDTGAAFCSVGASLESLDGTSAGGLVKLGAGTLSLSGSNTFTGGIIVSNGTLVASSPGTLPGYDRPGGVTLCTGTTLMLGDAWTSEQVATLRANIAGDGRISAGSSFDVSNGDMTITEDVNWENKPAPEMVGGNVLTLTGHNAFSGDFTAWGGILKADFGQGLDARYGLVLAGSTLASGQGVITNALGTGPGQIAIQAGSASGFTALGGPLEVNLGNGETIVAGGAAFSPNPFILNATRGDGALVFRNPIDLDGHSMTFDVRSATATLAGAVTNAFNITKQGAGELIWEAPLSLSGQYFQKVGTSRIRSRMQVFGTTDLSGKIWNTGDTRMIFENGADVWIENDYFQDVQVYLATRMEPGATMEVLSEFALHRGTFEMDGASLYVRTWGDTFGVGGYWSNGSVAEDAKLVGNLTLHDGVIQTYGNLQVGRNGPGTLTQKGGTITVGDWPCAGRHAHGVGEINLLGGTFNQENVNCGFVVGEDGIGRVTVGGTAQVNVAGQNGLFYLPRSSGQSGEVNLTGGTLAVRKITCTANGTNRVFRFNGGTLRTTETQAAFIAGTLTAFEVGTFGGEVDTAGNDVTFNQPLVAVAHASSPVHRWSFNGDLVDSVGGGTATLDGNVTQGATGITLPGGGNGSGAVNLGRDLLPTGNNGFTLEFWARHDGVQTWSRVFEIGDTKENYVLLAWSCGDSTTQTALGVNGNRFGGPEWLNTYALGGFALGTEFHIAVTMTPNGDGSWTMTGYKQDAATGRTLAVSTLATGVGWHPNNQPADNFWLGRSLTPQDRDAAATYNEVRVWDRPLTEAELTESAFHGPDAVFRPFEKTGSGRLTLTGANSVPGAARVTAGTLALAAGASLVAPDGVTVGTNATLAVAADAVCPALVRFEVGAPSGCLVHAGTCNLDGVTLSVADSEALEPGRTYVVARAEGGFTGTPTAALPRGWALQRAGNTLRVTNGGSTILIR